MNDTEKAILAIGVASVIGTAVFIGSPDAEAGRRIKESIDVSVKYVGSEPYAAHLYALDDGGIYAQFLGRYVLQDGGVTPTISREAHLSGQALSDAEKFLGGSGFEAWRKSK